MNYVDEKLEELRQHLVDNVGELMLVKLLLPYGTDLRDTSRIMEVLTSQLSKTDAQKIILFPVYRNIESIDFEIMTNDSPKVVELEKRVIELEDKIKPLYS